MRAIIFDCFGVLTSSAFLEFLATLPDEKVEIARSLNYQSDAGQITQKEYFNQLAVLANTSAEEVQHRLLRRGDKNMPLLSFIGELSQSYAIGLLSNVASDWIRQAFLSRDEQGLFDDILLSYEVHLVKPQPEIYLLAARRLGSNPGDCVMIDDSQVNCKAAEQVGMKSIQYQNFVQCKRELSLLLKR